MHIRFEAVNPLNVGFELFYIPLMLCPEEEGEDLVNHGVILAKLIIYSLSLILLNYYRINLKLCFFQIKDKNNFSLSSFLTPIREIHATLRFSEVN